jgi:hypothetical protein
MSTRDELYSPENLPSEELTLLDIQTQHAQELKSLGITDKAKARVDQRNLNHLTRAYVSVSRIENEEGILIERPTIRLTTPSVNQHGHRQTHHIYATVAEVGPDSISLQGDFSLEDLQATQRMIAELENARDLGVITRPY